MFFDIIRKKSIVAMKCGNKKSAFSNPQILKYKALIINVVIFY